MLHLRIKINPLVVSTVPGRSTTADFKTSHVCEETIQSYDQFKLKPNSNFHFFNLFASKRHRSVKILLHYPHCPIPNIPQLTASRKEHGTDKEELHKNPWLEISLGFAGHCSKTTSAEFLIAKSSELCHFIISTPFFSRPEKSRLLPALEAVLCALRFKSYSWNPLNFS